MPSRIPVRISEREFPSLNQARLHYVGILRKYQPGQAVSQDDGRQVSELLPNSATAHSHRRCARIPCGPWQLRKDMFCKCGH